MNSDELAALPVRAAFDTWGVPVLIASGAWAGDTVTGIPTHGTEDVSFGGRPTVRNSVTLKLRAADLEKMAAGTLFEFLDAGGEPVERRVVQGDPQWADSRRLTAVVDTAPV